MNPYRVPLGRIVKQLPVRNCKSFGVDICRAETDLLDFITNRSVNIVLDVGANVGQFGEGLRLKGYRWLKLIVSSARATVGWVSNVNVLCTLPSSGFAVNSFDTSSSSGAV